MGFAIWAPEAFVGEYHGTATLGFAMAHLDQTIAVDIAVCSLLFRLQKKTELQKIFLKKALIASRPDCGTEHVSGCCDSQVYDIIYFRI